MVLQSEKLLNTNLKRKEIIEMNILQYAIYLDREKIIQLLLSNEYCKLLEKIIDYINNKSLKAIIDNEIEIYEKHHYICLLKNKISM